MCFVAKQICLECFKNDVSNLRNYFIGQFIKNPRIKKIQTN